MNPACPMFPCCPFPLPCHGLSFPLRPQVRGCLVLECWVFWGWRLFCLGVVSLAVGTRTLPSATSSNLPAARNSTSDGKKSCTRTAKTCLRQRRAVFVAKFMGPCLNAKLVRTSPEATFEPSLCVGERSLGGREAFMLRSSQKLCPGLR